MPQRPQEASRWPQDGLRGSQDAPREHPEVLLEGLEKQTTMAFQLLLYNFRFLAFRTEDSPRQPDNPPGPAEDGPRGPPDGPRGLQDGPKGPQGGKKRRREGPKKGRREAQERELEDDLQYPQHVHEWPSISLQRAPKGPQEPSKGFKTSSPETSKRPPRSLATHSKSLANMPPRRTPPPCRRLSLLPPLLAVGRMA